MNLHENVKFFPQHLVDKLFMNYVIFIKKMFT